MAWRGVSSRVGLDSNLCVTISSCAHHACARRTRAHFTDDDDDNDDVDDDEDDDNDNDNDTTTANNAHASERAPRRVRRGGRSKRRSRAHHTRVSARHQSPPPSPPPPPSPCAPHPRVRESARESKLASAAAWVRGGEEIETINDGRNDDARAAYSDVDRSHALPRASSSGAAAAAAAAAAATARRDRTRARASRRASGATPTALAYASTKGEGHDPYVRDVREPPIKRADETEQCDRSGKRGERDERHAVRNPPSPAPSRRRPARRPGRARAGRARGERKPVVTRATRGDDARARA